MVPYLAQSAAQRLYYAEIITGDFPRFNLPFKNHRYEPIEAVGFDMQNNSY